MCKRVDAEVGLLDEYVVEMKGISYLSSGRGLEQVDESLCDFLGNGSYLYFKFHKHLCRQIESCFSLFLTSLPFSYIPSLTFNFSILSLDSSFCLKIHEIHKIQFLSVLFIFSNFISHLYLLYCMLYLLT